MSQTEELVNEIKSNLSQRSASQKDEVRVMQQMLNDSSYSVGVYGASGKIGEYCPAEDARKMIGSVISSAAKVNKEEAAALANEHMFSKAEAGSMVNISKEFVNTYAHTGRKLPLGGRENGIATISGIDMPESETRYPKKVVEGDSVSYQSAKKPVPPHFRLRVSSPCPPWVK